MRNRMFKHIGLTLLCLAILVTVFAVNPVLAQPQRGSVVDTLRHKVTRSPAAQLIEMVIGPPVGSDVWTSSIRQPWACSEMTQALENGGMRPTDIPAMWTQGKTISSRSASHVGFFGFNYRRTPLDDVNFRHALAHLVNKGRIIGALFGNLLAAELNTPVPPAQGLWHNDWVDPHPYSPGEAKAILTAAGYKLDGKVWKMPDGSPIPTLRVYCPLPIVAPTSFSIAGMFVAAANGIGLTRIILRPMDFSTYMDLVFNDWDFDIFLVSQSVSRSPTHLYRMFHPENDYPGGENCYGMNYPELAGMLDVLWKSFDHAAKFVAVMEAQELVMGGSLTDPLPTYVPPEDPKSRAIPIIPVYSRIAYDAQNPGLRGAVNMFGYGINNMWTWMNIHWDPDDNGVPNHRPGTTDNMVVPILGEFPERLNPLYASTVYAWTFIDSVLDGLIAVNPYTLRDVPWLATSWSYWAVPGGMDVTFNLRLIDSLGQNVKWQDGTSISASDVKFAWDFVHDWWIPNFWSAFKYYDPANTVIVDVDTIRARMTTTSQWLVYDLAGAAYMLPPQIWEDNPLTGDPWTSTAEILGFDPSAYDPDGEGVGLPTALYGTGPFINMHSTTEIAVGQYGDLAANRDYWMTTEEIQDLLTEMFHNAGDVNYDGVIEGEDMSAIGLAYLTEPGDDLWNPNADICGPAGTPPDSRVNVYDESMAGKFYKETKYVPYYP